MKKINLLTTSAIIITMVASSIVPTFAYSKEETVYAKLKTDGTENKVIVSEHLKNDDKEKELSDVSSLTNIVNINGDEKFKQDGQTITWQTTDGNDIYYQGNTNESLPISMKISYKLNGKDTKLEDMLGKKGVVEITIDYNNLEKRTIDGEELYVPFVITSGTMLSTKTDSQVEVTNGKVLSNGSHYIVVAIAAPGLSENYDNNEELAKLNSITIKYSTTEFQLNSIMSVATPSLLSDTDLNFSQLSDMYGNMDKLSLSYEQIVTGGKQLQNGIKIVNQKMSEVVGGTIQLNDGISQVSNGTNQLVTGSTTLVDGINNLESGAKSLYNGVQTLSEKMTELLAGVNQIKTGVDVMSIAVNGGTYTDPQTGKTYQIDNSMLQNIQQLQTNLSHTKQYLNEISQNAPTQEEMKALIAYLSQSEGNEAYLDTMSKIQNMSTQIQNIAGENGVGGLTDTVTELTVSSTIITNLNSQLSKGVESLQQGAITLTNAVGNDTSQEGTLLNGAAQVSGGLTQVKDKVPAIITGVNQLSAGIHQLSVGANQLVKGTQTLKVEGTENLENGVDALVSGMIQFQDEGLNKLSDVLNNTIKKDVSKTDKLTQMSKEYKTFTGSKDDVEATTKFVMIVDSKSKAE